MSLRPSQIETLKLVASFPDEQVIASDLAHEFGITIHSAERRLRRLEGRGLLRYTCIPWVDGKSCFVHRLSDQGRAVVGEEGRT